MEQVHGLDLSKDDNSKKSRKGSIPKNVASYLKSASLAAFADEMRKLSDAEPDEAVEQAVSKLTKPRAWKTIGQTALMAGAAAPVIEGAGRFTKGFVDTSGGLAARARGGMGQAAKGVLSGSGVKAMTKGDVVSRALTAGAGGGVLAAAKEGLELHNARKSLHNYIATNKEAAIGVALGGPPSGPSAPSAPSTPAPTASPLRGSSNKSQRVGNTPIVAKSGVTRSMSGQAMNPRASLGDAMRPKV